MKRPFYISTALVIIGLFLSYQTTAKSKFNLKIFSKDGDKFWLVVDGEKACDTDSFKIEKTLLEGTHDIKIIFKDENLNSFDTTISIYPIAGSTGIIHYTNMTYAIVKNKNHSFKLEKKDAWVSYPLPKK